MIINANYNSTSAIFTDVIKPKDIEKFGNTQGITERISNGNTRNRYKTIRTTNRNSQ